MILKSYDQAKQENIKNHPLANLVRRNLTQELIESIGLDTYKYKVSGSVGLGRWAEIPWISIFDKKITTSAQVGYYIVFLFKSDMSGVYLSLNQGWTYFENKYGKKAGRPKLAKATSKIRGSLNSIPNNMNSIIDLGSYNDLPIGYELGHICGIYYELDNFPSEESMHNDLVNLLVTYQEISTLLNGRSFAQYNEYLLAEEDGLFVEDTFSEEGYQREVNILNPGVLDSLLDGEDASTRPDPIVNKDGTRRWPRNSKVAASALQRSKYKCSYDPSHLTFVSNKYVPFVEAHHLVPMSAQEKYVNSLDKVSNIVALCPNCHRMIHFGQNIDKKKMIDLLFQERGNELSKIGINVTKMELYKYYGISNKKMLEVQ